MPGFVTTAFALGAFATDALSSETANLANVESPHTPDQSLEHIMMTHVIQAVGAASRLYEDVYTREAGEARLSRQFDGADTPSACESLHFHLNTIRGFSSNDLTHPASAMSDFLDADGNCATNSPYPSVVMSDEQFSAHIKADAAERLEDYYLDQQEGRSVGDPRTHIAADIHNQIIRFGP